MEHITILGSGGFGLSLALSAYRSGHAVKVWSKFPEELEAIRRDGEHKQKLPGVPIPQEISLCGTLQNWQHHIFMHRWWLSIPAKGWRQAPIIP